MLRFSQIGALLRHADPAPGGGGGLPPATPPAPPGNPPPGEPPVPPAPGTPPAPAPVSLTSDQLAQRLKESGEAATKKFLKELGFDKPDDIKGALQKLKELETANLTEQERAKKQIEELTPYKAQFEGLSKQFSDLVDAQLKALPESVQKAITDRAGEDASKRWELIQFHTASQAGQPPPAPPPPPGPGNLGPGTPPPPPGGAQTKFQEWQAMKARHPIMADIFYQNHRREIERTRPA